MNKFSFTFLLILVCLLLPLSAFSAEVLQIGNESTIIIGDQNRNYTVKIACVGIQASKEKETAQYLQEILPRHSKVNLKPKGYKNGTLISSVIKIDSKIDIGDQLISEDLGYNNC
tara:strand:- start:368 stop:712 length:345 start_codon:yes stop_codon:yes gene_type:complete